MATLNFDIPSYSSFDMNNFNFFPESNNDDFNNICYNEEQQFFDELQIFLKTEKFKMQLKIKSYFNQKYDDLKTKIDNTFKNLVDNFNEKIEIMVKQSELKTENLVNTIEKNLKNNIKTREKNFENHLKQKKQKNDKKFKHI